MIFVWIAVLIVSLIVLVKAADYFTEYSEKIGLAFGLSSFIIGSTIVAFGTSLPELISSLYAVIGTDSTEFVVDNVIGSNVANALLIIGIGAIYAKTLKVKTSLIDVDLPFFFLSMGVFTLFAWNGEITILEGLLLLGLLIIFMTYSAKASNEPAIKTEDREELEDLSEQFDDEDDNHRKNKKKKHHSKKTLLLYALYLILSGTAIAVGAKYVVDSVLALSELFGISSSMITITVVALGTSLPEIFTSIAAIKVGNHGIAIGNVFGSNTINLLLVAGLPALFGTLHISAVTLAIGLPFLVLATFVAIFTTLDNKVRFWEGAAMLFLYAVFMLQITQLI